MAKEDKDKQADGAPKGKAAGKKGKDAGKDGGKKKGKAEAPKLAGPVKRENPPRLQVKYREEVVPALMKEFSYASVMQAPRLQKITINMGLGEAIANPKLIEAAADQLAVIAGQKPVVTQARLSIATFKLRQGMKIGAMVTLRRERMYEFLDRLVSFALPRVRDFKGVSPKAFDGRGNYTLGVREQIIFPEIEYDKIEKIKGLNITFVTSARTDEEGRSLLRAMGMPFRK